MRRFIITGLLAGLGTAALTPGAGSAQAAVAARAAAQKASPAAPVAPVARRGPTDSVEVGAFLDGLLGAELKDKDVEGATVAVVRDGKLLFAKGYGWADVSKHIPVDAEKTLFRIGSVTKLFTWTALMQLVEEGKVDLHADVNKYLDFKIPDTYPGHPITVWNLMTHTPGFEDRGFALFSETTEPRGKFLAEHIPARVRPPGEYSAYSNYGAALAGYIIQRVSGQSWEAYVRQHIFEPLGMKHAAMEQPLPKDLEADMSVGYAKGGDEPQSKPFETLLPMAPAGSGAVSAEDMARFMIAQLQDGEFEGQRIMADSTARLMHTRQFTHDPRLPGFDLGFYEQDSHGVHVIGHGGDTQWFHSDLSIFPDENLGVFVSYNTASGAQLSFGPFLQAFLDHYYPRPPQLVKGAPAPDLTPYLGSYRLNRMSYTTAEKAMGLVSKIAVVRDPKTAGGIIVGTPLGRKHYVAAGNDLFQQVDGPEQVAFQVQSGKATHFFLSDVPMMAAERVSWYQSATFGQWVMGIALLLFLTVLLALPARWLLRKRYPQIPRIEGRARTARWVEVGVSLLAIGFVVAFLVGLSNLSGLMKGNGGTIYFALTLSTLAAAGTLALLWYAIVAWREKLFDRWARIHYTVVTIGAVLFVFALAQWNLLGWRL